VALIHGTSGALGVGQQASAAKLSAATVAPTRFNRFHENEFTVQHNEEFDPTSGATEPEEVALGSFDVRARGTLEGSVEGAIGFLLHSVMGSVSVANEGAGTPQGKKATYTFANTIPNAGRVSLEQKMGTASDALRMNAMVTKMRYDFTQPGFSRWMYEAIGGKLERIASATAVTLPGVATLLGQKMHTITFDGVTTLVVRSGWWEVERPGMVPEHVVTSRTADDAEYGEAAARFELEVIYENMDQIRRGFFGSATGTGPEDAATKRAVKIVAQHPTVFDGGTAKFESTFDFDKVFLTGVSAPLRGRDVIVQRITGRAIKSANNKVVLVNTLASS
jgi:hypothetical protein